MRILEINKFFYHRGGAEEVFFDSIRLLREAGHAVAEFSMQSPKNLPSEYAKYFVSELPDLLGDTTFLDKLKIFMRLFYSREVEKKLTALVRDFKPDVVHIHNAYHHLSASLFTTLRRLRVPTVLTVHDAFLCTPNHSFMVGDEMREDLLFDRPWNTVRYRAINGKLLPSLAGALEFWYYQMRNIWDGIDHYIAPSIFYQKLLLKKNIASKKISVIPNAIKMGAPKPLGHAVVYIGRLHPEKGFALFMQAVRSLPQSTPVIVAGDGPLAGWAREYAFKYNLSNVEFTDFVTGSDLAKVYAAARVVVVPSIFYENCSMTILEALAQGRLVVASDAGGNPELVRHSSTGWLFKSGSVEALVTALHAALDASSAHVGSLQKNARQMLGARYSEENYRVDLQNLFKKICD